MTCKHCNQPLHGTRPCVKAPLIVTVSEPFDRNDSLRTCRDCAALSGAVCRNWRKAGMLGEHSPVFMGQMADMPQQCPGFTRKRVE